MLTTPRLAQAHRRWPPRRPSAQETPWVAVQDPGAGDSLAVASADNVYNDDSNNNTNNNNDSNNYDHNNIYTNTNNNNHKPNNNDNNNFQLPITVADNVYYWNRATGETTWEKPWQGRRSEANSLARAAVLSAALADSAAAAMAAAAAKAKAARANAA
ncbi:unnamed protein product, partial [Polarella glacialis]